MICHGGAEPYAHWKAHISPATLLALSQLGHNEGVACRLTFVLKALQVPVWITAPSANIDSEDHEVVARLHAF
jgi:hypothetical protein